MEKIKNLLKNIQNKKRLLIFGFLFLIIFLFWPNPSLAFGWWGAIVNAYMAIPYLFISLTLLLLILISWGFVLIAGKILDIVISPSFISLSYTNPAHNQIIKSGLSITQSFVNMLLVLALVYIALSIALRINETAAKKMLAKLIIVALLVNFAPVLCGLVVDASNITMNYFLKPISGGVSKVLIQMGTFIGMIKSSILDHFSNITDKFGIIMMAATQIIVNLAVIFAFILYAVIFLARYVAIWTLVILAPFAFICWALAEGPLPQIKKMWDMWLSNFIEWSIIGIPMAFFLYLSIGSFNLITDAFKTKVEMPGIGENFSGFFDNIFPYSIVLVFLFLGFVVGLSTSAMGANSIIAFAKKKETRKWAWEHTKFAGSKIRSAIPEKVRKFGERQMATRKWGEGEKGTKGWGKRLVRDTIGAPIYYTGRYARRGLGKLLSGGVIEPEQSAIKNAEEKFKNKRLPAKLEAYHNAMTDDKKIGIINTMIKEGQIDKAMDEKKLGKSAIQQPEIERLMKKAEKWEADKTLKTTFPHLNAAPTEEDIEAGRNTARDVIQDRISKMKPDDYKNISKSALDNMDVVDAMLATAMGNHISKLVETHGQAASKAIEKAIDDRGAYINPRLNKYLISQAGQGLISPKKKPENWNTTKPQKPTKPIIIPDTETEFKKAAKERTNPISVIEDIKEKFKKKKK